MESEETQSSPPPPTGQEIRNSDATRLYRDAILDLSGVADSIKDRLAGA